MQIHDRKRMDLFCDHAQVNVSCPSNIPLFETIVGGIMLLFSIICIVSNTMVLVLFLLSSKLQFSVFCMIINLALADLLVGMFTMPFYALELIAGDYGDWDLLCQFLIFGDYVPVIASILSTVAIAGHRYDALHGNTKQKWLTRFQKNIIGLFLVWFVSLGLWFVSRHYHPLPIQLHGFSVCMAPPATNVPFAIATNVLLHHIPSVAVIYLNSIILVYVRVLIVRRLAMSDNLSQTMERPSSMTSENSQTASQTASRASTFKERVSSVVQKSLGLNSEMPEALWLAPITVLFSSTPPDFIGNSSREIKVMHALGSIIVVHVALWLPASVIYDVAIAFNMRPELNFLRLLAYVNSALNPFLYAFSSEDFQREYRETIGTKVAEQKAQVVVVKRVKKKKSNHRKNELPWEARGEHGVDPDRHENDDDHVPNAPCPTPAASRHHAQSTKSYRLSNLANLFGMKGLATLEDLAQEQAKQPGKADGPPEIV